MNAHSTSPSALYALLETAAAPVIVDVRCDPAFEADDTMIAGAMRRSPEDAASWDASLPLGRPVVAYCVHGHEVSQDVAQALRSAGVSATFLEGRIEHWRDGRLPTRCRHEAAQRWVTRERPKIDRIACPWLIRRFIEPGAEFLYVPTDASSPSLPRPGRALRRPWRRAVRARRRAVQLRHDPAPLRHP